MIKALTLAVLALALLAAGCGGDDDDSGGGGDEDAYVATYEKACKAILGTPDQIREDIGQIDPTEADSPETIDKVKSAMTTAMDTFRTQIDAMADADAPDKYADFQGSLEDNVDQAREGIDEIKSKIEEIDSPDDLSTIGEDIDDIDLGDARDLPDQLANAAPSCQSIDEQG